MRLRLLAAMSGGAVVAFAVGRMTVDSRGFAIAVAAAPVFLAVLMGSTGLLAAVVLPASFLTSRVGPSALDLSVADLALVCSIPVALLAIDVTRGTVARLLRVIAVYQLILLFVVAAKPTQTAVIEWAHRLGLMGGAVLVGALVVRFAARQVALRLLFGTAAVFSVAAVLSSATHGLAAAYPLGLHKNAAGSLLAMTIALLASMPPDEAVVPAQAYRALYFLYGAGLAATRSRGAMLGLALVLCLFVFAGRGPRRFRMIFVLAAAGAMAFVWTSVQTELRTDTDKTGSISVRERQQSQALSAFRTNRLTGAGIRYYDQNPVLARDGRPSSTPYEVLAESGVIGAAGLVVLIVGVFRILLRVDSPYAAAAIGVLGVRVLHGLVDNFWVAGPFTLPWLIVGIAAAVARDRAKPDTAEDGLVPIGAHAVTA